MNKKELTNIKNRIVRASRSLSVMGDLMLSMDIQNKWNSDELAEIYVFCAEKGIFHKELTQKVFG